MSDEFVTEITRMSEDFDRWYTDVVRRAELADYSPVGGFMVIRPYGYAVWEAIQRAFDDMIKATGHENWYFPLLIPENIFMKEAEHVEGFAPEVAWVTQAGGGRRELDVPLVIRPTSETIIGTVMRKYIHSYRDLPQLTNQWCNVVRWEMRTRLFLRTAEFLWQEGHTFHATYAEAAEEVATILGFYRDVAHDWLAMPVLLGRKSEREKFAGADYTTSIEAMMRDGLALQAGTSHHLGQNFARAYDIGFTDQSNRRQLCYTTSWGISTRLVGGLIMAHGDDSGLIMPPRVAPVQAVVVPIYRNEEERRLVAEYIDGKLPAGDRRVRIRVDWREGVRPGAKYSEWELKGVPLRIEAGPRDVRNGTFTLVDRIAREKRAVPAEGMVDRLVAELEAFHQALWRRALEFRAANTFECATLAELKDHFATRSGFMYAPWCGDDACEGRVKEETAGVTIRNFPTEAEAPGTPCLVCARPGLHTAVFARAY